MNIGAPPPLRQRLGSMKSSGGVASRAATVVKEKPRVDREMLDARFPGAYAAAKVFAHRRCHHAPEELAYKSAKQALWDALDASPERPEPVMDEYGYLSDGPITAWKLVVSRALVQLAVLDVVS